MKRLFTIFAMLLGMLGFVGCNETPGGTDTPVNPGDNTQVAPQITLTEVEVAPNSFTFSVTTNVEGTLGYMVAPTAYGTPTVDEWFVANSKEITGTETITVEGLNDNTEYRLYAILRAKNENTLSAPKNLKFVTPDDGVANPVTVLNATYDTISFSIDIPGSYVFQCIDKDYLDYNNLTPETYIAIEGIGISQTGPLEVEWVNGNYYGPYEMRVREDSDYYIIAAIANGQTVVGEVFYATTHTPKRPASSAGLTIELLDITSTSVNIKTTPDSSVSEYYVYVRDKAWSDGIVEGYGESMLATLVAYPSSGAWHLTQANEAVWSGLEPNVEQVCHILVLDNKGGQTLSLHPFTTLGANEAAAEVEASLTADATNGYCTLNLNLYSANASSVRYAFNTKADVDDARNEGNDDSAIAQRYGMELTAEQVAAIKTTGLTLKQDDLFPGVEYVAVISVRNSEKTETVKVVSATTPAKPVPARVESDLFTSLLGEWEVSYSLVQFNNKEVTLNNAKVTIAQGADDETADYYRNYNRLVIQGWPFNVEYNGTHSPMPYYSPADLKEMSSYWRNTPALALRDYGPKIFLEIAEGDVITVPSSRSEYLYNWASDGTFYFYGADIQNSFSAPATFPVTLSADGDTLTIGACHSGAEYDYGIYRPSVFRYGTEAWALATGDIVLKRVK